MTSVCRISLPIALALSVAQVAHAQTADEETQAAESASSDIAQAAPKQIEVATQAGAGGEISYADSAVVELGGTLALTHASKTTTFRITPSLGYFVVDRLELTLFPDFTIMDVDGNTDFTFGVLLEPSYHVALGEYAFAFAGFGVGLRYAKDPGVDFAMRPKLGLDILVGRSGIFKPALFLDVGANDGVTQGGFEAGFTVML